MRRIGLSYWKFPLAMTSQLSFVLLGIAELMYLRDVKLENIKRVYSIAGEVQRVLHLFVLPCGGQ